MANPTVPRPFAEQPAAPAVGAGGGTRGLAFEEPLVFERAARGRSGASLPPLPAGYDPAAEIPAELLRAEVEGMPELGELEVVRHFTRLSAWNWGIDTGFYPLGSCTMKYNPKSSEALAQLAGFDATTLSPAAGAHGELTGLMLIRAWHVSHGNPRKKVLIPDTAHGTNPASSALNGYQDRKSTRLNSSHQLI